MSMTKQMERRAAGRDLFFIFGGKILKSKIDERVIGIYRKKRKGNKQQEKKGGTSYCRGCASPCPFFLKFFLQ